MIFEIYNDKNPLFMGQLTGYTRSRLKALSRNVYMFSLGQNIILGTIKLKSWINMLPRFYKYSRDQFILKVYSSNNPSCLMGDNLDISV